MEKVDPVNVRAGKHRFFFRVDGVLQERNVIVSLVNGVRYLNWANGDFEPLECDHDGLRVDLLRSNECWFVPARIEPPKNQDPQSLESNIFDRIAAGDDPRKLREASLLRPGFTVHELDYTERYCQLIPLVAEAYAFMQCGENSKAMASLSSARQLMVLGGEHV